MPEPRRVLNLISHPRVNAQADFNELAEWIAACDPEVAVRVLPDAVSEVAPLDLPMLTVSPGPLIHFRPARGPIFQGQHVAKSAEYRALDAAGIPVPRWQRLLPGQQPDLSEFGEYLVTKPDFGARGADVRIERRIVARWQPPRTATAVHMGGPFNPRVAQEFVYTGAWPRSYRVATLFGNALWAMKIEASHVRAPLPDIRAFHGQSVVSSGRGCTFELACDADVIALAERAHGALPRVPLLGVDVLRDVRDGRLFVVELNSLGFTWHFSSPGGLRFQSEFSFDLGSQFDGRRKAARLLAKACVDHAA